MGLPRASCRGGSSRAERYPGLKIHEPRRLKLSNCATLTKTAMSFRSAMSGLLHGRKRHSRYFRLVEKSRLRPPRGRDDVVAPFEKAIGEAGADALGSTGDYGRFPRLHAHLHRRAGHCWASASKPGWISLARSIWRLRNSMNSRLRWRSLTRAWTWPVSRSMPASKLTVPRRLYS